MLNRNLLTLFIVCVLSACGGSSASDPTPEIEDPIIEDPVIEDPIIEDPIIEDPVIEDPIIEDPIIEDPVIEDPIIEDPIIEDPVIEPVVILPSETGIELQDWYLSVPTNNQGKTNDKNNDGISSPSSDSISISDLTSDYQDDEFFYGVVEADGDKGIVMICPPRGPTTSENTYYTRVELRELLARGTVSSNSNIANNWVFSSANNIASNVGGIDGELNVTLAVNHVTTTFGEDLSQVKDSDQDKTKSQFEYQVGRVVIGQIHASSDEPIRLYYRKLPDHAKGSIYFYHEPTTQDDEILVELIGEKNLDIGDSEPADGIELNEKFSYKITVVANELSVTISRDGKADVTKTLDMTNSGFDEDDEWHYFKVGLYHLNNTAADDDYVQATFYEIRNSHTGYDESE